MNETEAVREARRWRREVYEQTHDLSAPQRRAREDELLRTVREAGVEFEEIIDTDTEATQTRTSPTTGRSKGGPSR
ncbi:MAG: hypothetical protein V3W34_01515 [Phycisphaerae bacterium]